MGSWVWEAGVGKVYCGVSGLVDRCTHECGKTGVGVELLRVGRCVNTGVWRVKEDNKAGVRKRMYNRCIADVERQVCELCKFGKAGIWQVWEGRCVGRQV